METVPDGLTHEQRQVLARVVGYLEADARIEAAWLTGSLARGLGDRFSDVDVCAAVAERALREVVEEWPARAPSVVDLAFTRRLSTTSTGATFTHVTPDYGRFDVTFITTDQARKSASGGIPLLESSSVDLHLGSPGERSSPSADRVSKLSEEFLRVLGLLPVVIGRNEDLVAASGAALLRSMLMDLFLELAPPGYRGGAMRAEKVLSADQLEILHGLPPLLWTRDAAIALHVACARQFLPAARQASDELGLAWPQAFEDAVRDHLCRELDLTIG